MTCECRSGARTLAVLAPGFDAYPELVSFGASRDWAPHPDVGAVLISVGPGHEWAGVEEVAAFLRAVLDADRFAGLRAAWVRPSVPLTAQLVQLLHAEPLSGMAERGDSPLAEILDAGRLETWFQPIFWAGTLGVWGYECLLRARDAAGGLVTPGQLLGWARDEQMIFRLDRMSRETHLRNAGAADLPDDVRFLVNFLPTSIYRPEFCLATTVRAAAQAGLDADRVIFEVVETERVPDMERLRSILDFYRRSGFGVALDDVGSGWSGLSLFAEIRPDLIKIDRALVSLAPSSPSHRQICAALARLGHEGGQLVLAEGVETREEWQVMSDLGANLFQGFLFGRPAPEPARAALV